MLVFPDGTGPALLSCLIAGIPLNRVHELDYGPGEVRMNVNYNTVHAMLPTGGKTSKEYQQAIERGSKQLEILRSATFVGRKDRIYAEEQKALEEQEAASRAQKLERQQKAEEERRHRYEESKKQKEVRQASYAETKNKKLYSASPTTSGDGTSFVAGMSGIVSLLAICNRDATKEPNISSETVDIDSIEKEKSVNQIQSTGPTAVTGENFMELEKMESLIESDPILIPEFASSLDLGSADDKHFKSTTEERIELAEIAMNEYLDKDDGAEAFYGFMDELMSEE